MNLETIQGKPNEPNERPWYNKFIWKVYRSGDNDTHGVCTMYALKHLIYLTSVTVYIWLLHSNKK